MAEHVVNDVAVEVHLPGVLGLERSPLDLDDDVAAQAQVVEEQVEIEVALLEVQVILAPDERAALTQFDQELLQMGDQSELQLALTEVVLKSEEVEDVGVLERLLHHVGVRRRDA